MNPGTSEGDSWVDGTWGFLKTKLLFFFLLIFSNFSTIWDASSVFFTFRLLILFPGPLLLLTTWAQFFWVSSGRFLHLLTIKTQALQISPDREQFSRKQFLKESSYFPLSVNLELEEKIIYKFIFCIIIIIITIYLLDFALQMQQPSNERNIFGLW